MDPDHAIIMIWSAMLLSNLLLGVPPDAPEAPDHGPVTLGLAGGLFIGATVAGGLTWRHYDRRCLTVEPDPTVPVAECLGGYPRWAGITTAATLPAYGGWVLAAVGGSALGRRDAMRGRPRHANAYAVAGGLTVALGAAAHVTGLVLGFRASRCDPHDWAGYQTCMRSAVWQQYAMLTVSHALTTAGAALTGYGVGYRRTTEGRVRVRIRPRLDPNLAGAELSVAF